MTDYEQLRTHYADGNLCLFVGAGVSMGSGLPDWKGLAEAVVDRLPRKPGPPLGARTAAAREGLPPPTDPNLLFYSKSQVLTREDPLLSMRYARSDVDLDLKSLVSQVLYSGRLELSDAVLEIPLLERVKRICCYNYDDLLDRALAERNRPHISLFAGDRIPLEEHHALVFYPHGFLPDPNRASYDQTDMIVLSEDDYFDLYRDPYAWGNLVQLILLLNYTVLFVGCSLMDPNVRRLLDVARRQRPAHRHFGLFRDHTYRECAAWYESQESAAFRSVQSQLLAGLGVQPIWVQDHTEVPSVLRALRA